MAAYIWPSCYNDDDRFSYMLWMGGEGEMKVDQKS